MKTKPPTYLCFHPKLRPTEWNQPKPEPAKFKGCSHNYRCPVCEDGAVVWPDPCWMKEMEKAEQECRPLEVYVKGLDKPLITSYLSLPVSDPRSPYYPAWCIQG